MSSESKTWESLKIQYLNQVEKALSSVEHPRRKEVLDDVRSHLDQRFAELADEQRTWENFQAIITEMGPACDYAELLGAGQTPRRQNVSPKFLLLIALVLVAAAATMILLPKAMFSKSRLEKFRRNFPEKVAKLNIDTAKLDDIVKIFGQPVEYIWGREILDRDKIPTDHYCIEYPDDFYIFMRWDSVVELRFESPAANYVFRDKIRVGSSLNEVLSVVGEPSEIVEGKPIGWVDGVLYKDIEGRNGYCYYHRSDKKVRFFFLNYKVKAIYLTRSDYNDG
jgi:hypothetical protein